MTYTSNALGEYCQKGKYSKTSFKAKKIVSTSSPLELIHINLFGPVKTTYINGKKYGRVIVDDYSRWTWVKFLKHKDGSYSISAFFCSQVQNEKDCKISEFEVIMVENLKIRILKNFLIQMAWYMIFLVLELHKEMGF